ncbi:MAG: proteasome assembly chaperone family protein [Haloferacaceae archaeon]
MSSTRDRHDASERFDGPEFTVSADASTSDSLIVGFSAFGLAGLTAVDYLVDQLDLVQVGHVTAEGLPSITPFEQGVPRHPTRLFSREDLEVTVLVGELFVPAFAGEALSDAILEWTEREGVRDIAVLSGIPIAHGPEEHRTYYVATEDYRERHLTDTEVQPMGSGFLDGANAALVEQGLDSPLGVGVYITAIHQQVPDVDAAIRLVETIADVYGLAVDSGPLQEFAAEVQQYYSGLAERMDARERDVPEDRMYM